MDEGKWITINGAHVFLKEGQSPMDAFVRDGAKEHKVVFRSGTTKGQLDSGTFFASTESDASNYGTPEQYQIDKNAKLYEGLSSQNYAKENNLMNKESKKLEKELGVKTLKEVEDIYYNWQTPSYLDKNPNLYFYAFQYMAKEKLKEQGYDGAFWIAEDELTPEQYQIWNEEIFRKIK